MASAQKEPVRLRTKKLANGNESLYLDIYINGKRNYEFLRLYLIPEKSKDDKQRNRETLTLANSIKQKKILDIQLGEFGLKKKTKKKILFFDYFVSVMDERKKKASLGNYVVWQSVLNRLKAYEKRQNITFDQIDSAWLKGFLKFLQNDAFAVTKGNTKSPTGNLSANSCHLYFSKLRTLLNQALEDGIIVEDPMRGIKLPPTEESKREYLSMEEVKTLVKTRCDDETIKKAFLFSCFTGLRRSDVEKLTWGELQQSDGQPRLVFRQKKTGGQEYLDINPQALELLGERGNADAKDKIFPKIKAPQYTNYSLQEWARRAGIEKHITFHSGRHTFAVMMLTLGTDIYTVSKLLGHKNLHTTEIYAKIVDSKKQAAVNNIPRLL